MAMRRRRNRTNVAHGLATVSLSLASLLAGELSVRFLTVTYDNVKMRMGMKSKERRDPSNNGEEKGGRRDPSNSGQEQRKKSRPK